jgi:hypothetical protein
MLDRRTFGKTAAATVLMLGGGSGAMAAASAPERDRQAIKAMAGNHKVRFDFRETVSFQPDYKPLAPKLSGGEEIVRVVEDRGDFISLQHILVMDIEGQTYVTKHWRQDWQYQPRDVLQYEGLSRWALKPVAVADSHGAWSQTVWQTDDSPRYGGTGRWTYDGGVSQWTSEDTWRPLARRDAVRKPPYDRYLGRNRHALTPNGWVHEQENAKQALRDGKLITVVHEVALNTYERFDGFKIAEGDAYWAATKDYWAGVRADWDAAIRKDRGVHVQEEAENGSVTGPELMGWADEIAEGKLKLAEAATKAQALIAKTAAQKV